MMDSESTDLSSADIATTNNSPEADTDSSGDTVCVLCRNRYSASHKVSCATDGPKTISSQTVTAVSSSPSSQESSSHSSDQNAMPAAFSTAATRTITSTAITEPEKPSKRLLSAGMPKTKRPRSGNPNAPRFMRPIYRTTSVTTEGSDFTVHKEPAIPQLDYHGTRDIKYEGIKDDKEISRASFITLRVSRDKAHSAFQGMAGPELADWRDPQRNRPFVTLKYRKT